MLKSIADPEESPMEGAHWFIEAEKAVAHLLPRRIVFGQRRIDFTGGALCGTKAGTWLETPLYFERHMQVCAGCLDVAHSLDKLDYFEPPVPGQGGH